MNKNLKKIINYNREALEGSKKDLKAIFDIMFHTRDNVLCEYNDGFRIYKETYGEIYEKIVSAGAALYEKIGAKHSFVALEMENCPEWIVAFWAILLSGNKPYLVNMRYPLSLTNSILKTLEIEYTVCADKTELDTKSIDIKSLEPCTNRVPEDVFEDEIAFSSSATSMNEVICFYSGKQISEQILNFKSIVKESPLIAKHYKGSLKQLAFLPFYHVFGLFAVYFWFTFFGRTLVFLRDYSAETILKTCRRHEVTHIFAVPMLWHTVENKLYATLKEQGEKKQKKFEMGLRLSTAVSDVFPSFGHLIAKSIMSEVCDKLFGKSVMFVISGGSYLRDSAIKLFNGIGYPMHNGYGMSEIGITSVELRNRPKYRNLNSIGRPFDSVEYRLDENGVLFVRGSSLCTKKLVNGEAVTPCDWFCTEDIMTERDGYYFIQGRTGDVVIGENGENINPDTIEKHFNLQSVKSLCVLGLEGEQGEELSLVAQISPYIGAEKTDRIVSEVYAINNTLPKAMSVRKFYFTYDDLAPPTAVKVSRKQLLNKIKSGETKLVSFADVRVNDGAEEMNSAVFTALCKIISEVLGVDTGAVKPDSHIFFDLGATSIQYFSILVKIAEEFGIEDYDKGEAYRNTPKEICEYIEDKVC